MSTSDNNGDIEMFSLRRSARIAEKERQKFIQTIHLLNSFTNVEETKKVNDKQKIKHVKSKETKVKITVDTKSGGNIKKKPQKPRTTKKRKQNLKKNKFINLETTKINDVFPLIKKYSHNDIDKNEKYHLLKTIIKYRKDLNISNRVADLYIHKALVERNVYKYLQHNDFTLISISNHLNDILSYKEIDDLDSIITERHNDHDAYMEQDCNNLINSLNMMSIQSKEQQMKKDLDEIEKLNSIICRLMV